MPAHVPDGVEVAPEVVFPEHFGFCGGVAAADQLATQVAQHAGAYGLQVIGLHDIVHNRDVTARHEAAGVQFVQGVDEVPGQTAVIISAHGVGPEVIQAITAKGSEVFDATCPLVKHTHRGVEIARKQDEKIIYVCHGKPGEVDKLHDEVAGMLGHLDYKINAEGELVYDPVERAYLELDETPDDNILDARGRYRIVTQTTLHADDCLRYREAVKDFIEHRQPGAVVEWSNRGDVCRAVADRQQSVEQIVKLKPRRIVVVTDRNSKNGRGYVELAKALVSEQDLDTQVYAVEDAREADLIEDRLGLTAITASASTPTETIHEVAAVFGEFDPPVPADKEFHLHDARSKVLTEKMAALAARNGLAQ